MMKKNLGYANRDLRKAVTNVLLRLSSTDKGVAVKGGFPKGLTDACCIFDGQYTKSTGRAAAWNRSLMDGLVLRKDRASDEHPPRIDEYHCIR
jgi:hypothetical protein